MAKFVKPLTETQIKNLKPKATPYADGNNLYLFVYPSGAKSFAYIYTHPVTKKRVKKKIGDYPDLVLFDARDIAHKYSRLAELEQQLGEPKQKLAQSTQPPTVGNSKNYNPTERETHLQIIYGLVEKLTKKDITHLGNSNKLAFMMYLYAKRVYNRTIRN